MFRFGNSVCADKMSSSCRSHPTPVPGLLCNVRPRMCSRRVVRVALARERGAAPGPPPPPGADPFGALALRLDGASAASTASPVTPRRSSSCRIAASEAPRSASAARSIARSASSSTSPARRRASASARASARPARSSVLELAAVRSRSVRASGVERPERLARRASGGRARGRARRRRRARPGRRPRGSVRHGSPSAPRRVLRRGRGSRRGPLRRPPRPPPRRRRRGGREQPRGDDLALAASAWMRARICWQTSGCSRRKAVAFWRPWPSRSSSKLKYEPDFWTIFRSSPTSSTVPSQEMPEP